MVNKLTDSPRILVLAAIVVVLPGSYSLRAQTAVGDDVQKHDFTTPISRRVATPSKPPTPRLSEKRTALQEDADLLEDDDENTTGEDSTGFRWKPAIEQSLMFLAVRHGVRVATEPRTRSELRGPLLKDYFRSVSNLGGWDDGDPFYINYVAHPLQGSVSGFIQIQNDPKGIKQEFGRSKGYWMSRLKAMGWSAASSTQWELGPLSEAMIGNVGLPDKYRERKRPGLPPNGGMGYVDLVITPTLGAAELIAEDAADRYFVRWVERRTGNRFLRATTRSALNPARSFANILRFKKPWHRDNR